MEKAARAFLGFLAVAGAAMLVYSQLEPWASFAPAGVAVKSFRGKELSAAIPVFVVVCSLAGFAYGLRFWEGRGYSWLMVALGVATLMLGVEVWREVARQSIGPVLSCGFRPVGLRPDFGVLWALGAGVLLTMAALGDLGLAAGGGTSRTPKALDGRDPKPARAKSR
jgi:hypothetical protein